MPDYFLQNYETNWKEKVIFPIYPVYVYRHLEEAFKSKTWLGRVVHPLIATLEAIPLIGAIIAIAEKYLSAVIQLPNDKKIENPILIANGVHPKVDKEIVANRVRKEKELEDKVLLDEKPSLVDLSITEQPIDPIHLSKDDVSTQKEATYRILTTKGFVKEDSDILTKNGYKGEVQGTKDLRFVTAKMTKKFPRALSPAALKEQRDVNLEQYLTFKIKRFGHAFALKNFVSLPSGNKVNLEGFCESFTVPMLFSSFDDYAKDSKFYSEKDKEWILDNFNQITTSDYIEPDDIQALTCMIQDPNFVGPVGLGTGYAWHSTATVFFKKFIIFCNRGGKGSERGIYIYYLPDPSLITEAVIWEMTKRQEIIGQGPFQTKGIAEDLKGKLVFIELMSGQGAGNCTYISMETALYTFMVLKQLVDIPQECIDDITWKEAFDNVRPEYEKWRDFDRKLVFKDMIEEIQEWKEQKNAFSKNQLWETYHQILKTWYTQNSINEKYKSHAFIPITPTVKKLLEEFMIPL